MFRGTLYREVHCIGKYNNILSLEVHCIGNYNNIIQHSGNLSREKAFANWLKNGFHREKFLWIAHSYCLLSFKQSWRELSHKTVKFIKVFSLESFPLNGSQCTLVCETHCVLTSRTATCPPATERTTATRSLFVWKASESPGTVLLRGGRWSMVVLRCERWPSM